MVPKTSDYSQNSTYPRQNQCFGRQVIENRQSNQNRVGIGSVDSEFNLPNVQLSRSGSVCDTFHSQTYTLCFPSSGQSSLCDRCILQLENLHAYAFPPTILPVLNKIRQLQCRIVLIAPLWPQQTWFSEVLQLLVSAPVRLPLCPKLLTKVKWKFQHQNLPALKLHIWELSSNQLEIEYFHKTLQFLSPNQGGHQLRKSVMRNGPHIPVGDIERRLIWSRSLLLL